MYKTGELIKKKKKQNEFPKVARPVRNLYVPGTVLQERYRFSRNAGFVVGKMRCLLSLPSYRIPTGGICVTRGSGCTGDW